MIWFDMPNLHASVERKNWRNKTLQTAINSKTYVARQQIQMRCVETTVSNVETRRNWVSWTDLAPELDENQGICAICAMRKSLPWRLASWHTSRHREFLMRRDLSCECSPVNMSYHMEDLEAAEEGTFIGSFYGASVKFYDTWWLMVVCRYGWQASWVLHSLQIPSNLSLIHTLYVRERFPPWSPNLL